MGVQSILLSLLALGLLGIGANAPHASNGPVADRTADTCFHALKPNKLPRSYKTAYQPFDDVTIRCAPNCGRQMLQLPSRGTVTSYVIVDAATADTVHVDAFRYRREPHLWDITLIRGDFKVRMNACHMSGDFKLSIR